ncbi:MAG TPA: ribulose-phosphate 3-epimerase [Bacteroidia bacterium]|jgi:ribulose-phosphate 3-epimerase|nr:ribulose-phosphate 3-epimerase [Bacteroidia bacterium]
MSILVAPSLLSADFGHLADEIHFINDSQADWFHVDVMDGVFVPNISFGFPVMNALKKDAKKPLDVHLMLVNPDHYIEEFAKYGTHILTVHYEACTHLHRTIQRIKAAGMKAGVAINPHTPVTVLYDILQELDLVLVMSVNPGFGGQKFIPRTIDKVKELKKLIEAQKLSTLIEVDGGVDPSNARALESAGVNVVVAGNAVFGAKDRNEAIKLIKG